MNILIVDDHTTNRKLLRVTLEAESHALLEASDGIEALEVLARENVDAIISDILMPNMDGFRLCHEVRKSEVLRTLPFIIYTGTYTSAGDMKLAQTVGADKYLVKPVPSAVMIETLRSLLEHRAVRPVEVQPLVEDTSVLKQYSQTLVNKLEEKNAELRFALSALQQAHEHIMEQNAGLEHLVLERTSELETSNRDLRAALAEVKELSGLLPICAWCKKIKDADQYWRRVEDYISHYTKAEFTHGICPECKSQQMASVLATKEAQAI
jgi:CheY-like chemotaxis protein